jgi:hypothetical protein
MAAPQPWRLRLGCRLAASSTKRGDHDGDGRRGRLNTIKIKATIAANEVDEVDAARAAYRLDASTARSQEIYFCDRSSPWACWP